MLLKFSENDSAASAPVCANSARIAAKIGILELFILVRCSDFGLPVVARPCLKVAFRFCFQIFAGLRAPYSFYGYQRGHRAVICRAATRHRARPASQSRTMEGHIPWPPRCRLRWFVRREDKFGTGSHGRGADSGGGGSDSKVEGFAGVGEVDVCESGHWNFFPRMFLPPSEQLLD